MQVSKSVLIDAELDLLKTMRYEVWVGEEEYWMFRGRLDEVWEEWGRRTEKADVPSGLVFRTQEKEGR